jgi:type VI protein secretion system component VasK
MKPFDLIGRIGVFRTTNILATLLAVLIIVGVFASGMTISVGPNHFLIWALWIAFLVVLLLTIIVFIVLLFVNPRSLQTEEFRLEEKRIEVLTDERHPGKTIEHEPLTANTALQAVKGGVDK